jgi:hypothetical protein
MQLLTIYTFPIDMLLIEAQKNTGPLLARYFHLKLEAQ